MSKCEWKDGKFKACNDARIRRTSLADDSIKVQVEENRLCFNYCPFCGADIIKPEPEVIIKKSGETWVAHFKGVDYLWTSQAKLNIEHELRLFDETGLFSHAFKPISEIKITDEIAKLRPMVKIKNDNGKIDLRKLTYIDENFIQCAGVTYSRSIVDATNSVIIATDSDLENSNENIY